MQSNLWAVDIGAASVSVIVAQPRSEGPRILGLGQAKTHGTGQGELSNIGDAAECLVEAIRVAEKASGSKCGALFYNFDDAAMESCVSRGFRVLAGEGQIRQEDVNKASEMACRQVAHFEKSIIYSREMTFLIDGKDAVVNPLGVFGRQLDVDVYLLLARARQAEGWKRVIERAGIGSSTAVLSLLSSAFGVLEPEERQGRRIVWDLGRDRICGCVFERGGLRSYAGYPAGDADDTEISGQVISASSDWAKKYGSIEEMVLTGDLAERAVLTQRIHERSSIKTRTAAPSGQPLLDEPRYAAAAGLVRIASVMPRERVSHTQQEMVSGLRRRAEALINEYF